MKAKLLVLLAAIGIVGGIVSAYLYAAKKPPQPPVFPPAEDPYAKGVYANGVIESYLPNGENINIFPEVAGTVTQVAVVEGAKVTKGTPLIILDSSIQTATVAQQKSSAEAALTLLGQLKAQPRKEVLAVNEAQVAAAAATLKTNEDSLSKLQQAFELNPKSISKTQLDDAINAVKVAKANLETAQRQYELTQAGAWIYDIQTQERQYDALEKTHESGKALLEKYTIRAPVDGVVMKIQTAAGSFVSTTGAYGTYTEGYGPVVVMAPSETSYQVRCYIDEILVTKLPPISQITARMFPRGTTTSIPLEFVRIQPYVTPKIQLSNQRTERVDLRVLPVLFRFTPPKNLHLYPGMLVDVYLEASGGQKTQAGGERTGNEGQGAIGKSKKKKSS